ncbi:MAG TPA: DUF6221 family protein [Cellulomonadaceae bacterium]|nr:DUF6221 family protein [Cellulomonadaceae bacterium]
MTPTEFLTAMLDEDEAMARRWPSEPPSIAPDGHFWRDTSGHPIYAPRAFVLADVASKRAILALHQTRVYHPDNSRRPANPLPDVDHCDCQEEDGVIIGAEPCETKLLLAQPYSDHPDFNPAWQL